MSASHPDPAQDLRLPHAGPQKAGERVSGGLYVWGVDVSTRRAAVGFAGPTLEVRAIDFRRKLATGARLDNIFDMTRSFAAAWARAFPPLYCFVEQPAAFGRPVEPALMYAVGVVQAALYHALRYVHAHPVEVRTVPIGVWKARAVGHGHAKKADVAGWAARLGFPDASQDECDALGVAVAGRALLEPEPEQLALGA